MYLSIGELAEKIGVSISTLYRWDKTGQLKAEFRTKGNHRRYKLSSVLSSLYGKEIAEETQRFEVGYGRTSSSDQKDDLKRQEDHLRQAMKGCANPLIISDLGSGLNFKKRGLNKLITLILADKVSKLYLTHKDRLLRFGYELVAKLLESHGGEIILIDEPKLIPSEVELAEDVLSILTVFSAKLYGKRSHHSRQKACA